jgi:hypothetical protein
MIGRNDGDAVELANFFDNAAETSINKLYGFDGFFQISRVCYKIGRGEISDKNVVFSSFRARAVLYQ